MALQALPHLHFLSSAHHYTNIVQSTLVISKSKGPSKKLRDIRTSTYQTCSIEGKKSNNQISQMTM